MNVANAIVDKLKTCDTDYFFMLTGGDQPLWIALHDAGIKMVVARSEFSSVYMADGYARASGKPGFTYGQAGPGAANVAAALADPYWAQSPVIALTGATATDRMYKWEYQSIEQMPMFNPVTTWNGYAASPEVVPDLVSIAIVQAMMGNRGPTHLDIPKNHFPVEISYKNNNKKLTDKTPPLCADSSSILAAIEALFKSKKPVILAGEGAVNSDACEIITRFAETFEIPVATTMGGKTCMQGDHPLYLGVAGRYSAKVANDFVEESDCVLVIGSRLGGLATRGYTVPNKNAQVIMIDNDAKVFDVSYPISIKLIGDAKLTMESLFAETEGKSITEPAKEWSLMAKQKIQEWRNEVFEVTEKAAKASSLSPFEIMRIMSKYNMEITVVADTGYMAAWSGVLYRTVRPHSYYRAIGSLGWALPASLGVQLARTEKVVCVTGDGGAGYHLSDIETAVRHCLPVIIVVLNNSGLIFEYHEQKYRHNGRVVNEANDLSDVDFSTVARGLGAEAKRVQSGPEFEKAFKVALESENPTVIDVKIDREAFPPVSNFEHVMERRI